ncbi:MAG: sn-glycerol-3-phosphate ABC transporter ATP-binding protein UgpC [Lachnospiraceae bacterium]|nr:sn-glycerol-3-phosphate ABC transporter ATP-binding protein UgpC [Lachnospiraceae bacterium]
MATITLKNISKVFESTGKKKSEENTRTLAVSDFNLEIKDKEFVVLVGPSGCGKSTTLRMIAGLEEISSGELYIDDVLVNDIEPKDRDIAMVFQNYALYPHMTVYDNIAYPLKLHKVPKAEIQERVMEAARILDIEQYLKRKPKALSGGQRQRVAIGRAIVRNPKVLLMDEPLSNLDAKLRNQMRAEIIALRSKINTTFVYVTHDQTEAMTLGDRIVIMKDGFIQQAASPQDAFDHPANIFVAGFIGAPSMNFFPGKLLRQGDVYCVQVEDLIVQLPEEKCARLAGKDVQPQDITVGVRPSHINVDTGVENELTGTINVSEMMGTEVHLHVKSSGNDVVIIVPVIGSYASYEKYLRQDEVVKFSFTGEACHVFDSEGKNLEF